MDGAGYDPFLTMAVQQNDLSETRVPETRHDGHDVVNQYPVRNDYRSRHSDMMIGMSAVIDRQCNGTSGYPGNLFRHPGA